MESMTINLAVKNIADTVEYYQKNFGFLLQMAVDHERVCDTKIKENKSYLWAMLHTSHVSLMLQLQESLLEDVGPFFKTLGASATLYFGVKDIDIMYQSIKERVTIFKPIETTWYGQREFYVQDLNGYLLCFAQQTEPACNS